MLKSVLFTGGAGYVGSVLTPKLLKAGYHVTVYDSMLYGREGLPVHPNLRVVKADIRDTKLFAQECRGIDAVIHFACISNDPSFDLDSELSKQINFECFEPMVVSAKEAGVKRFIYASSSSVYGVSDAPEVTEEHPLVPLTDYNKYKGLCEPLLLKYQDPRFTTVIIRPATVCGYSPRQRLDLSVNILTNHAINNRKITVFGGEQKRPNIHIDDLADLYVALLTYPSEKIAGQIFNAGYQNLTLLEIAQLVKSVVEKEMPELGSIPIVRTETNDPRSYHVNSDKIGRMLGFVPHRSVEDAVRDICQAFRTGKLTDSMTDSRYYNVKTLKENGIQ